MTHRPVSLSVAKTGDVQIFIVPTIFQPPEKAIQSKHHHANEQRPKHKPISFWPIADANIMHPYQPKATDDADDGKCIRQDHCDSPQVHVTSSLLGFWGQTALLKLIYYYIY